MSFLDKVRTAWNAFRGQETIHPPYSTGASYTYRPSTASSRPRFSSDKSITTAVLNRIAIDSASIGIRHVKVDNNQRYSKDVESRLNDALMFEPNLDQSPRAFRQDLVMTLLEHGAAAIVPVDTIQNPNATEDFEVVTLRVGEITEWYPAHVKLSVYNEKKGDRQEITLPKRMVAIVENPLYSVMNEPNSTLQRLIRKLSLLDIVDEASASGKLDLIIKLPYVVKSETRRDQAATRLQQIETQMKDSAYGIAYVDGTEEIVQLNRPAENNLLARVEFLQQMLYGQLGITAEVMNGTANEATMLNYYSRTVEPILDSIIEAMQRTLLGPTRSSNNERIKYFRDPFKLVPVGDIADISDKFTRNEILTANELRSIIGFAPSRDPKADKLINSNMPQPDLKDQNSDPEKGNQNGT